ncbi:LATE EMBRYOGENESIS ABUNDANT (LEA) HYDROXYPROLINE-RICH GLYCOPROTEIN FAMILY [Salix purpurea]|uniref:LATE EMBRYOGENESIS ABUNDANT (LEA) HYDROXYPROLINE-RICH GLYCOPROTEIN FAMILY n=1 Tax=Salix purpurea TaxID=77065 RepID=A0A9Q0Q3H6_SALPP|nr:LATE EMBRYOGENESIS ABUNDANT (LEA) HYDROXYPROLINE-RICH GLYCOPROTEIN FAMILY [Salix purpurea]
MDVESSKATAMKPESPKKHKRRNVCLGVTAAAILVIFLILLILGLTVFKPKQTTTTVDSTSISDLKVSLDIARLSVHVNLSLDVNLSIKNPNKVSAKYKNSSASLNYRGQVVGEVPIPAGKISADTTQPMNVTLTLLADRLLTDSQFFSDAMAGAIPFNTLTKISGKVSIFNLFKVHFTSTTSCDLVVFVSNRTTGDQKCKYKTKL